MYVDDRSDLDPDPGGLDSNLWFLKGWLRIRVNFTGSTALVKQLLLTHPVGCIHASCMLINSIVIFICRL